MCGIAGFLGEGSPQVLQNMIDSIRHRGPDDQSVFYENQVGLAHARLSILDLREEGNQPMFSEDKQHAIVYNGEVFNFVELKKELQKTHNISFKTTTDTEVLLYLYKCYEDSFVERLNGMFAFAIYDFAKNEMILARDRMGQKPLYYAETSDLFVFSSEIKAITQHPGVRKELNLSALNQYLTFDYVPFPNSIYEGIYKLEPGCFLKVQKDKIIKKKSYWEHSFITDQSITFQEAKQKFDSLLDKATNARLMSDVPLGVFLSGGLDSSTVAYYAQKNASQSISTFSIGFEENSYDESSYAKQVSDHLGTTHYMEYLSLQKSIDLISSIYPLVDEPFADASLIPTYYLSQITRKKVTVALGGDGSDELLAGYPTFISDQYKQWFQWMPNWEKNSAIYLVNFLPASDKNISFDFKLKQFFRGFQGNKNHIHQLWLGSFLPKEKNQLFSKEAQNHLGNKTGLEIIDTHLKKVASSTDFYKTLYFYYKTYLVDDILTKVDRASMYHSLEVRAPFLDKDLVMFLNTLPKHFKFKKRGGKYILKELMRDKLPTNIIDRPKKGFGIPISKWIREDLKPLVLDLLSEESLSHGLFHKPYIEQLLKEHFSKKRNHRKLLWNLMMFQMWYRNWF